MTTWKTGIVAAALALAVGCGDGGLSRADVEDIPPGDATGTDASGVYDIELYTTDCRGGCSVFGVALCDVGDVDEETVTVTQTDGELVIDGPGLVVERLFGGIDTDGSFVAGGYGTENGGTVEIALLSTGTLIGGVIDGDAEGHAAGTVEGGSINCTATYAVTGARAPGS